ncbi:hypothetical protein [Cytobacillus purgationiresistens]|uniref:Uncharacterized protein n=1 Tax=Cytobacillus purgationiresistens TaxID=863449 RepID=A0ABU0ABL7_9BACI|nr:hypothetical protein [Cytobacillus purgationiresistens]MDQ0268647.1 hypothetical protein [Cytobacillus purgationiresistens]
MNKKINKESQMDHPEQYKTNKKSLFDSSQEEKNVDPLPMEDLKQENKEEANGKQQKNNSSTQEKYKVDFETSKKKKIIK